MTSKQALRTKAPWITKGRVLASTYALAMLGIAFLVVPKDRAQSFVLAARYLGSNTRMTNKLWTEPPGQPLRNRIELDRLEKELDGKYIQQPVDAGEKVMRANVMSWPKLPDEEILPVTLEGEPDWSILNQGSTVQVWIGQRRDTPTRALVLAIVASDKKWIALLRRSDFATDILGSLDEKPTLRLVKPPQKPPAPPPSKP